MTQVEVVYRYGAAPSEMAATALGGLREVYGIRKLEMREAERTVCVEYDSTRLTEPVVRQLLRRAGLDVAEEIVLAKPVPPPVAAAPTAS